MSYLTTALLSDIRDAAALPSSSVPGTDDTTLLRMANMQMRGVVSGLVRSVSEEYYIRRVDLASPAGQRSIRLPDRAVAASTRTIDYFAGPTGANGLNNFLLRHLERVDPERLPAFQPTDAYQGLPWGFYIEAATVNLVPLPAGLGTIRVRYQHRPGAMVIDTDTNSAVVITNVSTATVGGVATYHLTAASIPSGATTTGDVIAGTSPFETLVSAGAPAAATATTIDFAQTLFSTAPAIGDWICVPDTSPIAQVPVEMEPLLATLTAVAVLRAKGRSTQADNLQKAADIMRREVLSAMAPRTKGNVRVVTGGIRTRTHGPWGNFRY